MPLISQPARYSGPAGQEPAVTPAVTPYSVIISEVMADPIPVIGLPGSEYIEIFNRNIFPVTTGGWKIVSGNRSKILPNIVIDPGSYALICDASDANAFAFFGRTILVYGMPALLNNEGVITLKDSHGNIIHTLSYSADLYESDQKAEGGWSLEIIDTGNPCGKWDNWSESHDSKGGTPGNKNSVEKENKDLEPPELFYAIPEDPASIRLFFSENMDSASLANPFNYSVSNGILQPLSALPEGPAYTSVLLNFNIPFSIDKVYRVMMLDLMKDCAGNFIDKNSVTDFALPRDPQISDVIFNEVLFDASDRVPEFIEFFNRSEKVIDIADLSLLQYDPAGIIKKSFSMQDHHFLLFPGCYVVITRDARQLRAFKSDLSGKYIIELRSMFVLPDDEGHLALTNSASEIIDRLEYSEDLYKYLKAEPEGNSLERTSPDLNSGDQSGWLPASGNSGYATPGCRNSQTLTAGDVAFIEVNIIPEIFSPDDDGIDDNAEIKVTCHDPGSKLTVCIFDARGRMIKVLSDNLLSGTVNTFIWDGRDSAGKACEAGIYLVNTGAYGSTGKNMNSRKAVTVIRRY